MNTVDTRIATHQPITTRKDQDAPSEGVANKLFSAVAKGLGYGAGAGATGLVGGTVVAGPLGALIGGVVGLGAGAIKGAIDGWNDPIF